VSPFEPSNAQSNHKKLVALNMNPDSDIKKMKQYEDLEIRCPRLGGQVTFAYCLHERGDLPCPRVLTCWQTFFPVETYLKEKLTPEERGRCFNEPPKDKISTIFEIVEAVKKRKKG